MAVLHRARYPSLWTPRSIPTEAVEVDRTHPLAAGLSGFWLASDLTGTDLTGIGTATFPTSPTPSVGPMGPTLNFTNAPYMQVPSSPGLQGNSVSIVTWVRPASFPSSYNTIASLLQSSPARNIVFFAKSGGKLALYVSGTNQNINYDGTGAFTLSAGNLYCLVATAGISSGSYGYVNGALDASNTADPGNFGMTVPLYFGKEVGGINGTFNGLIGPMSVYNRVLSPAEVAWLYNEPFAMLRPVARRVYYTAPSSLTAALLGRSAAVTFSQSYLAGSIPIIGRAETIGTARATPYGAVPIIGRSGVVGTAKASGSFAAALLARGEAAARAKASATGAVPLLGRSAAASTAKSVFSFAGLIALLGRAASAATAKAAATGAVHLLTRAASASTARSTFTFGGLVALISRSAGLMVGRGSATGKAALLSRAATTSTAAAQPRGALTLTTRATGAGRGAAAPGFVAGLIGRAAGKTTSTARAGLALAMSGRTKAQATARSQFSGVTVLTGVFGRAMSAIRGGAMLFALRPAQPPEADHRFVAKPIPRTFTGSTPRSFRSPPVARGFTDPDQD